MVFLFGGVEAVVFAAGGALFGRQVERGKSAAAEKRADSAEAKAEAAQGDAEAGRALRAAVEAEFDAATPVDARPPRPRPGLTTDGVGLAAAPRAAVPPTAAPVERLALLADKLFTR